MPRGIRKIHTGPAKESVEPIQQKEEQVSKEGCQTCGHEKSIHFGSKHHQCNKRHCLCEAYQ